MPPSMNPRFKSADAFIMWWDEVHETNSRSGTVHPETDLRDNLANGARCRGAVRFKWAALKQDEKIFLKMTARARGLLALAE